MAESQDFCTKCGKITVWAGSGKRQHCKGCGVPFPCVHDCRHYDCKLAKGIATQCGCGMILLPGKKCVICKK